MEKAEGEYLDFALEDDELEEILVFCKEEIAKAQNETGREYILYLFFYFDEVEAFIFQNCFKDNGFMLV